MGLLSRLRKGQPTAAVEAPKHPSKEKANEFTSRIRSESIDPEKLPGLATDQDKYRKSAGAIVPSIQEFVETLKIIGDSANGYITQHRLSGQNWQAVKDALRKENNTLDLILNIAEESAEIKSLEIALTHVLDNKEPFNLTHLKAVEESPAALLKLQRRLGKLAEMDSTSNDDFSSAIHKAREASTLLRDTILPKMNEQQETFLDARTFADKGSYELREELRRAGASAQAAPSV